MVKDKLNQIIKFLSEGIEELSDSLENTANALASFQKSLGKVRKDLKRVKEVKGETIAVPIDQPADRVSSSSNKEVAKEKAASLLFNMLSTGKPGEETAATASSPLSPQPPKGKAPSGPPTAGPPTAGPPKAGPSPPKMPPSTSKSLPSPPKMPPSGPPGGPPKAPSGPPSGLPKPPMSPPSGPPGAPAVSMAPAASIGATGGPGLGGLREEMLKELDRLKKIMRGS